MLVAYPVSYGALTPLYAVTMPEALAYNGKVRARSRISLVCVLTGVFSCLFWIVPSRVGPSRTTASRLVRPCAARAAMELVGGAGEGLHVVAFVPFEPSVLPLFL